MLFRVLIQVVLKSTKPSLLLLPLLLLLLYFQFPIITDKFILRVDDISYHFFGRRLLGLCLLPCGGRSKDKVEVRDIRNNMIISVSASLRACATIIGGSGILLQMRDHLLLLIQPDQICQIDLCQLKVLKDFVDLPGIVTPHLLSILEVA
jgi:hypothetical protein